MSTERGLKGEMAQALANEKVMISHETNVVSGIRLTSQEPKRRGRRRGFDLEHVLDSALEVFWQRGYSATSLNDIVAATGVHRPSLYSAFGNKEGLYFQAIAHFRRWLAEETTKRLNLEKSHLRVSECIGQYLDFLIRTYVGNGTSPKGDVITCSSLAETAEIDAFRQLLISSIDTSHEALEAFFQRAKALHLITPDAEPKILSYLFGGLISNLQQRARAGATLEELTRISSGSVSFLLGTVKD